MAIDFPNSPVDNDTYTFGDKTWIYADGKWTIAFTSTMTLASLNVTGNLTVDTTTLKVDSSSDRVGIGTASPTEVLDVRGNIYTTGSVIFEGTDNLHETTLAITDPTADRTITLPDIGGTVITTGNLSGITSTGTLSSLNITGALSVDTSTFNVDAINNRVGIGTASPSTALQVVGTVTATAFAGPLTGNVTGNVSGTAATVTGAAQTAITSVGTLTSLTTTGNVVMNNASPTAYFQDTDNRSAMIHVDSNLFYILRGDGTNSLNWATFGGVWPLIINLENNNATFGGTVSAPTFSGALSGNASTATSATSATSATTATNQSGGTVSATYLTVTGGEWLRTTDGGGWYNTTHGIGLNAFNDGYVKTYPANGGSTSFSANYVYVNGRLYGPGSNSHPTIQMREGNGASWSWTGTYTMYVDVTAVKTFVIDHPIKQDNYLVHACAEGPTSDVFYRGTGQLQNGVAVIELPDYFESLTEEEGRTVMITPIADETGNVANLAAHEIYEGKFIVELAGGYVIKNQRFWWRVDAVRKNTSFAVEPEKSSVTVGGDGPYTYIQRT